MNSKKQMNFPNKEEIAELKPYLEQVMAAIGLKSYMS